MYIRSELYHARDYRDLIQREFERRRERNSRYSLRAFARDFKISPSFASEFFNGKSRFSKKQACLWAELAGFNAEEVTFFGYLVDANDGSTDSHRQEAEKRLSDLRRQSEVETLRIDSFRLIAEWHHLAILEALSLPDAQHSPAWLANRLTISEATALESLHRLERLNFIVQDSDGRYQMLKPRTMTGGVPSEYIKQFHTGVLEKAGTAIYQQPMEIRDYSTTIFGFDSTLMPKYRELLTEFRQKVVDLARESNCKDAVYSLSLQMFQLTNQADNKAGRTDQH
jgi:uncharacterized protein (TIGR02147 family)